MNTKHLTIISALVALIVSSCGRTYEPYVDTTSNVYKQLSMKSNSEIDSMVKKVERIEEFEKFSNSMKVLRTQDEMEMITAMINLSIEGDINIDSLGMDAKNTVFIHNKNNLNYNTFMITDTTDIYNGYTAKFIKKGYVFGNTDASNIWDQAMNNYTISSGREDSITVRKKVEIESSYDDGLQILNNLKYVVLVDDAMLIPPVIDTEKDGFVSGYVLTHLYAYDINSLDKVGQMMVVSSNSDQISYLSFSKGANANEATIGTQLRTDLMTQKRETLDSIFTTKTVIK